MAGVAAEIAQTEHITGMPIERAYVARGYRGEDADMGTQNQHPPNILCQSSARRRRSCRNYLLISWIVFRS